jgi:6-hydroxytryprostatin B O-methyltransferase
MEFQNPTLKDLATAINKNVSIIDSCLEQSSLPKPSFAIDGLRRWDYLELDGAQEARIALIDAATDLMHLAMGPYEYLRAEHMAVSLDPTRDINLES